MTPVAPGLDLAAELDRVGFVVVPLLDAAEVATLVADFEACHPDPGQGFETDFERDDASFKSGVAERTQWVWDRVEVMVPGYAPFMASYLVKWPTPDSHLALHADWSYVDEDVHPSYAVWVPLVDTGPHLDNGPLAVVPGSHRLVRSWRGTATPAWYEPGHDGFMAAAVLVDAPAGSAVIFDNRLLHHSPPNASPVPRPVLAGAFAPDGAQLLHVVGDGAGAARVLEVDAAFFQARNPSGLRAEPPSAPDGARTVPLVVGAYDPVALAADHGIDDASLFGSAPDRRWPEGRPDLLATRAALPPALDLTALSWAPSSVDAAPEAAVHLALVVDGQQTPMGERLLGPGGSADWDRLRLVLVAAGDEATVDLADGAGAADLAVVGLRDGDPSALLVGETGWAAVADGDAVAVPEAAVVLRNRADHPIAVLVGRIPPAGARPGRVAAWLGRRRPTPAWQLAVELTEAVS